MVSPTLQTALSNVALYTGCEEPTRKNSTDTNQPNTSSCRIHGNNGNISVDVMLPTALQDNVRHYIGHIFKQTMKTVSSNLVALDRP